MVPRPAQIKSSAPDWLQTFHVTFTVLKVGMRTFHYPARLATRVPSLHSKTTPFINGEDAMIKL